MIEVPCVRLQVDVSLTLLVSQLAVPVQELDRRSELHTFRSLGRKLPEGVDRMYGPFGKQPDRPLDDRLLGLRDPKLKLGIAEAAVDGPLRHARNRGRLGDGQPLGEGNDQRRVRI